MDMARVKRTYGDRVAVIGGVDCGMLLQSGTVEEVRRAVERCIETVSAGGGHILSSSNAIHSCVRPENYLAMVRAAREFGRYPVSARSPAGAVG